jgi:protease inhibitor Inh
MARVRTTPGILVVLTLTGCAGERVSLESAPAQKDLTLPGRWILSTANAPTCGLEFGGAAGGRGGSVSPDGGCPGKFYMSRRWSMEDGAITITDAENQPLAHFRLVGDRYEGQSTGGTSMTLSR